jgi:hypothetical protein
VQSIRDKDKWESVAIPFNNLTDFQFDDGKDLGKNKITNWNDIRKISKFDYSNATEMDTGFRFIFILWYYLFYIQILKTLFIGYLMLLSLQNIIVTH